MGDKENMSKVNPSKVARPSRRILVEDAKSKPSTAKKKPETTSKNTKAIIKPGPRPLVRIKRKKNNGKKPPVTPKIVTAEVVGKQSKNKNTTTSNQPKSTKQEPATKSKKDMKLPRVRKVHIKVRYIILGIIVAVFAVFFGRVAIWEKHYLDTMTGSERDNPNSSVGSIGSTNPSHPELDETEPTEAEIFEYTVPASQPRYLTIRSLGIYNSCIVGIGLLSDGTLDVPQNIYRVGWYTGSVLPGQVGVSLMNAHGGDLGNGIFKNLPKIAIGAEIEIEMGDGRKFTYVVTDVAFKNIGADANNYLSTALTPPRPGAAALTLITCTGEWSQVQQTYMQRFYVRAVLK